MTSDDSRVVLEVECFLCGQPRALAVIRDVTRICQRCREAGRRRYDRAEAIALLREGYPAALIADRVGCTSRTIRRLRKEIA